MSGEVSFGFCFGKWADGVERGGMGWEYFLISSR